MVQDASVRLRFRQLNKGFVGHTDGPGLCLMQLHTRACERLGRRSPIARCHNERRRAQNVIAQSPVGFALAQATDRRGDICRDSNYRSCTRPLKETRCRGVFLLSAP